MVSWVTSKISTAATTSKKKTQEFRTNRQWGLRPRQAPFFSIASTSDFPCNSVQFTANLTQYFDENWNSLLLALIYHLKTFMMICKMSDWGRFPGNCPIQSLLILNTIIILSPKNWIGENSKSYDTRFCFQRRLF